MATLLPSSPAPAYRPKVLTLLPGESSPVLVRADVRDVAANQDAGESEERFEELVGPFSAVRAARVAHMYRVDFWSPDGASRALSGTNPTADRVGTLPPSETDMSESELDTAYQEYLLNSYVPASLQLSRAEFDDFAKASRRAATLYNSQGRLGGTRVNRPLETDNGLTDGTQLAASSPFAEQLSVFCAQRAYTMGF